MNEQTANKPKKKSDEGEGVDPVHVVRRGALAASIWKRQSPSGFAYYDFSLSRSWKSMSSEKMGYSKNFFETNQVELVEVIQQASAWIAVLPVADVWPVITTGIRFEGGLAGLHNSRIRSDSGQIKPVCTTDSTGLSDRINPLSDRKLTGYLTRRHLERAEIMQETAISP